MIILIKSRNFDIFDTLDIHSLTQTLYTALYSLQCPPTSTSK